MTRQCEGAPTNGPVCPFTAMYRLTLGDVPGKRFVVCVRHLRPTTDLLHTVGREVRIRRI